MFLVLWVPLPWLYFLMFLVLWVLWLFFLIFLVLGVPLPWLYLYLFCSSSVEMAKKLLLVDADCGVDDAQALMMALAAPQVQVLGVTCCFGNAPIENVCRNTLRVLRVCNRTEIPVFRGAASSLVGTQASLSFDHFGTDGLGDTPDEAHTGTEYVQKEHAVNALIRIVCEHEGQVSLVAVGPLTNLALAVRMDPTFPQKLKDLYIMGGNMEGKGNRTVCGEFNFVMDPEAAYVVLNEFSCPMYIATWDFTCRNKLPWEFFDEWVSQDGDKAAFMKRITSQCRAYSRATSRKDVLFGAGFVSYDSYAMAAAIDSSVMSGSIECSVSVELRGELTRGMMILDPSHNLNKKHKAFLMKEWDMNKFTQLLMAALKQSC
ncbi:inosine-uridine preferring nucleoside hydrolase-like isoform X1 [Polyodon spathula]|uniref:inosine-uridine preferring nucleoside hydrolase-like isoform X1 n=1 Tax=Polyodon spathula TaxID=7913 RepID=UPI001B7ED927|nr:inosine-uridine preferring nucleoside hydrolase-like isoform X1 [Polyodon spathula]